MVFDYSKLRGRIVEKGVLQKDLADELDISENTLSVKLKNGLSFASEQIFIICRFLEIPLEEAEPYFFTIKFDQTAV